MKLNLEGNKIFEYLSEISEDLNKDAYLVGGLVRDWLIGKPNDDIDIVVVGSGIEFAEEFAKRTRSTVQVFKNFGTAKVDYCGLEVEFVGARKESYQRGSRKPIVEDGTLEDDLTRRDFTINALAASLRENNFGEIVDLFGGLNDLRDGILRTPTNPNITFSDDPLRMLRCIRFYTKYGFKIDGTVINAIKNNIDRINIVSKERIYIELDKIMQCRYPYMGFLMMQDTGLLKLILPELSLLDYEPGKNEVHHKNNFLHTMEVLQNISRVTKNVWLKWAALFHDIGKGPTKKFEPGIGWTFHNHEYVGAKMVESIFKRLKFPLGPELSYVKKLVSMHMRPSLMSTNEITDSAVRRLVYDAGDDIKDLICLCECDLTTKNEEKKRRVENHFVRLKEMIQELIDKDYKRLFQPCINGDMIMKYFNLRPCREIGIIKDSLKDAVLDGVCENNPEELTKIMISVYNKIRRPEWPEFLNNETNEEKE